MPVDIHLKSTLEAADVEYGGDNMYKIFGPSSLSWANTDSSRMYMFTSHLKQTLTLIDPDVPRLMTGFENSIGKRNKAYKKLEGTWDVIDIIPKFPTNVDNYALAKPDQIVTVVLYNRKTKVYEMIEKPIAEDLTEKFGYMYNSSFIDSLEIGQRIKDPIMYKSTAYDKHMNYRYGKNARVYYSTSSDTIEDAIVVRRGWAEGVKSIETDSVFVPINNNDVLLNLYGDDNHYKPFPNIGEKVKNSLICATRRINNSHLLYDFQKANMREVMDVDTDYYVGKDSIVYDINVYYNGDEPFPDNLFYRQLKSYYDSTAVYADRITAATEMIKDGENKFTPNVGYFKSKYSNYNDKNYKWKNKDSIFGNIIVEFKVRSIISLEPGSKGTGRWGNKGVISNISDVDSNIKNGIVDMMDDGSMTEKERESLAATIRIEDDERMVYYINPFGEKVYADLILNTSGSIRRLNPGQNTEVETNFIGEQVQYKVIQAKTREEKVDILFKFLSNISEDESVFFKGLYEGYDQNIKVSGVNIRLLAPTYMDAFIRDVEENGFHIVRPPHKPILFDDVIRLYDTFPDIKPVDLYVDLFGRTGCKLIKPGIIGYQYMLILKQNSNKNFSARSTFRVSRSNLPAKDIAKKTNRSSYARTPVRLSEIYNLLSVVSGTDLAEYNIFMRSSALGRKSLDRILYSNGNPLKVKKLKIQDNFTNANADILAAKMKTLGLRVYMSPIKEGRVPIYDADTVYPLHFGEYTIHDVPGMRQTYQTLFDAYHKKISSFTMIETYRGERQDTAWDLVFDDLKDDIELSDNNKDMLKACTRTYALSFGEVKELYQSDNLSDEDSPIVVPRKRGRKSKAELEAIRLENERLAEEQAKAEKEFWDKINDTRNDKEESI